MKKLILLLILLMGGVVSLFGMEKRTAEKKKGIKTARPRCLFSDEGIKDANEDTLDELKTQFNQDFKLQPSSSSIDENERERVKEAEKARVVTYALANFNRK